MPSRLLPLPRRAAHRQVAWPLRGPRSIFAKGLRDSRRATLLAGVGLAVIGLGAIDLGPRRPPAWRSASSCGTSSGAPRGCRQNGSTSP